MPFLGNSNIDDPTTQGSDPSDGVAGFDLRVSAADPWGGSWVAYLHLVGEDEAGYLPSKIFGTVGVQGKAVFARQRFEATLEATDTMLDRLVRRRVDTPQAPAYTHGTYVDGYYQGRLPIGAPIGGGGQFYTLGLGWTPVDDPGQLRVFGSLFRGRVSETGPQSINAAFGAPGTLSGFSLAFDGETPGGVKWQSACRCSATPAAPPAPRTAGRHRPADPHRTLKQRPTDSPLASCPAS